MVNIEGEIARGLNRLFLLNYSRQELAYIVENNVENN